MSKIGVNAWVWTSPATTEEFARLVPLVSRMGFDLIEIGIEGTSDVTPEESAARQMELRVEADVAYVVLRDERTVQLVRTITESFGGSVRGDDAGVGSMAGLWQAVAASLEDLRRRLAPAAEESESESLRSTIVGKAIQSRLARRRKR